MATYMEAIMRGLCVCWLDHCELELKAHLENENQEILSLHSFMILYKNNNHSIQMHGQHQEIIEFKYLTCIHACSGIQSCPTFCDPTDYSPPSFSVHGIFSARIPFLVIPFVVTISSSRGSSWPRDRTWVSCTGRWILYHWATLGLDIWPTKRQRIVYVFSLLLLLLFSCSACWILCDPMDCSTPGFLILHYLLESAQIRVHWVDDANQPSHSPLPPSPALNLSQHKGLFQWVSSSHQMAKVLVLQLQH